MVRYNLGELAEGVGNDTGDFLKDLSNNVANTVCGLYRDYAGNFLNGDVNAPTAFLKGTWDSLCAPRPPGLPSTPPPPFTGGQCPVGYIVRFNVSWTNTDFTPPRQFDQDRTEGVFFKVNDIRTGLNTQGLQAVIINCDSYNSPGAPGGDVSTFTGDSRFPLTLSNVVVTRQDGLPDTCGDPPGGYPTLPIPPGRLDTTTPYTYNDGVDINIPTLIAPITATGVVNVNVGGINFRFDAGGVEVETPGEEEEEKKTTTWLVVVLTKLPDKTMFGNPNVYFGGWVTFSIGDAYTVREQINFERSVFRYPDGATTHHITFTNKAEGDATTYTTKD